MNNPPMMACGHAANAVSTQDNSPCCAICVGFRKDDKARQVVVTPSLEGRTAQCSYGNHKPVPSNTNLAFFGHKPDSKYDEYYCGCFGFD